MILCCNQAKDRSSNTTINSKYLHQEIRSDKNIILQWERPAYDSDTVKYYQLLFKENEPDSSWKMLKDSIPPAITPSVTVNRIELKTTSKAFLFRVQYITNSGLISEPHYSSDSTASPIGGWFLLWE